jgi:hypothetical protein
VVAPTEDAELIGLPVVSPLPRGEGSTRGTTVDAVHVGDNRWKVGTTTLVLHTNGKAQGPMRSRGFRYLTVQVFDVRAEHARLLSLGWTEGTAPVRLGDTAYISFVLDPDGAPIEISQRASLTGPLPD